MKTKILTLFLPQFHRIPENDKWWGEGFTDWKSASEARALFSGHYQPRVPLDGNYYDMLDRNTFEQQLELMIQYGIYGQIIYHYWFKNGRQILEKPAENLLKWTEIEMPFCFSWAVESWARSWSGRKGANPWSNIFERPFDESESDGILLEQNYGNEKDWKQHFDYLLPFFLDERYIKKDGKPLFFIYKPEFVSCLGSMTECWQRWAKESGLPGIFFVGSYVSGNYYWKESMCAYYFHEPLRASSIPHGEYWKNGTMCYDYDEIWTNLLSEDPPKNVLVFPGAFFGFNNTPRWETEGLFMMEPLQKNFKNIFQTLFGGLIRKNAIILF